MVRHERIRISGKPKKQLDPVALVQVLIEWGQTRAQRHTERQERGPVQADAASPGVELDASDSAGGKP